jgi:hypothetical protein
MRGWIRAINSAARIGPMLRNLSQQLRGTLPPAFGQQIPPHGLAQPSHSTGSPDRSGWIRYDFSQQPAKELPGFGDGARLALEIVDGLRREFHIDERRI